jgi:hypothetical protein
MRNQKTLKQLIDEVIKEFEKRFSNDSQEAKQRFKEREYLANSEEEIHDFLRQSLIGIAKITAKTGSVEPHWLDEDYWAGYNDAIQERQQKLKEFFEGLKVK